MAQDRLENKLKKNFKKKLGILGGTFDPAHIGHVKISVEAKKKFRINKVIWAITKKNPFKKKSLFSLNKRIEIAKKITSKKKFIEVYFFEKKIKSDKTIKLINYLKKKYNNTDIYFLMGADNLINFHKWYKWEKILLKSKILVFDRHGYKKKLMKSPTFKRFNKKKLEFIRFNKINISSSKLKKIW